LIIPIIARAKPARYGLILVRQKGRLVLPAKLRAARRAWEFIKWAMSKKTLGPPRQAA
jgi:hypothetical protein